MTSQSKLETDRNHLKAIFRQFAVPFCAGGLAAWVDMKLESWPVFAELPTWMAFGVSLIATSLLLNLVFGSDDGGGRSRQEVEKRMGDLRTLLLSDDRPHAGDIFELLGPEMPGDNHPGADRVAKGRDLTDRFVAGFIKAEEYDRELRALVGAPGRGTPIR